MNVRAFFVALWLMSLAIPNVARAQGHPGGTCPSSAVKLAAPVHLTLPEDAKTTAHEIAFDVDIGSDGRVRGLQLDESSGDGAVDLNLQQLLQAASYVPAQTDCVAYSASLRLAYELPASASPPPTRPPKRNGNCTPYIHAFLNPSARDRKRTGTAIVAVELDAAGSQTGAPALRHSAGSASLDSEAVRIARTGQYGFMAGTSCTPQSFTYLLELTFQ